MQEKSKMPDNARYGDDSPIAAFATSPGNSALTLIRCSGKGSIELFSSVFSSEKINDAPGNTVIHGWIVRNEKIDEVLVSVFRAPKSYTGEDSLDISCHGGFVSGKAVLDALKYSGFREALPGEFTFRAFLNGKIDLTRCESVMELVSAKTDTARSRAVSRLSGSLFAEIDEIKKLLVQVLSGAEIYLDYSEDEIGADDDEAEGKLPNLNAAINVLARLKKLASSWRTERLYQEGLTLVIAGCPNAGKSSLFNALLKEDRSIVTEIPGTTRDWIEAWVSIEGIPVRLVDTAGLRETSDSVEKIGVERSRKLLQDAELVLYLIDGAQGLTAADNEFISGNFKRLIIWNKADINPVPSGFKIADNRFISVSAKTGEGLSELYREIVSAINERAETDFHLHNGPASAALGSERQKNLVCSACDALEEAISLSRKNEPLDLIAPLLREAVNALGEITGEVSTSDILEDMFSRFCVGK